MSNLTEIMSKIEERAEKATPGPWRVTGDNKYSDDMRYAKVRGTIPGFKWQIADVKYIHRSEFTAKEEAYDIAAFIAAARTDVPALVRALKLAIEQRDRWIAYFDHGAPSIKHECDEKLAAILEGKEQGV